MSGQKKRKSYLNKKVIIYQMPLLERIMGLISVVGLTSLPLINIFNSVEKKVETIILLIAMLIYSIYMFFCIFKTYIYLDMNNKTIIIREFPGIKKQQLPLNGLIEIKISHKNQYKNSFTIDIKYVGYSVKINSWSEHPSCRLALFNVYGRQIKRLNKFILRCEKQLKKC